MKKNLVCFLCVLMLISGTLFANGAQETKDTSKFPEKGITLIVPFRAGGGTDALARKLADIVGKQSGVQIIVETRQEGPELSAWPRVPWRSLMATP